MKRFTCILSLIVLVAPTVPSSADGSDGGWTRVQAESKVGTRVRYESLSQPALLQWGPVKKNGRPAYRKPLGRGVKPGSTGTVVDVVLDRMRGYEIIVEWDPDPKDNEVWESGLYKDNYGLVVEFP